MKLYGDHQKLNKLIDDHAKLVCENRILRRAVALLEQIIIRHTIKELKHIETNNV